MKIKCPLCDFENEKEVRFCTNCNEPLSEQSFSKDNPYLKRKEKKDENMGGEWIPDNKKRREKDQPFELISDEEDEIRNRMELVEILKGKIEKAFNDNITAEENVDVKLQPQSGQGIIVTDKRVMIIKAGMTGGAGFFGANCKSFYFNQITSVDLRLSVLGGHIQFTVAGSVDIKGKGLLDMPQSENAVIFSSDYKERMKYVANLIRERVQASQNQSNIKQNTSGASLVDQINDLAKLKEQGILSEEELQTAKRKLLS